ncbi:MAG: ribosome assembly RNA-binding protein YhbY [bacterium]
MALSKNQNKHLRGLAHPLHPVVMVGQHGLSDAVMEEIHIALGAHELIKVKVAVGDRDDRDQAIAAILETTGAELVQRIGNIAILFKRNPKKPKVVIPAK